MLNKHQLDKYKEGCAEAQTATAKYEDQILK